MPVIHSCETAIPYLVATNEERTEFKTDYYYSTECSKRDVELMTIDRNQVTCKNCIKYRENRLWRESVWRNRNQ